MAGKADECGGRSHPHVRGSVVVVVVEVRGVGGGGGGMAVTMLKSCRVHSNVRVGWVDVWIST